jgi:hypothetical protein
MAKRLLGVLSALTVGFFLTSCGAKKEAATTPTVDADGYKMVTQIGMTLKWKVQGEALDMIVQAPAKGWVGVGFDPQTLMKGADIVLGYVDAGGQVTMQDAYADQLTNHKADTELGGADNVTVVGGEETAAGTTLHFTIPLNSGDKYDKVLAAGTKHKVMLAYGTADDFIGLHPKEHRKVFEVEL